MLASRQAAAITGASHARSRGAGSRRACRAMAAAGGFQGCAAPLPRPIKVVGCGSICLDYLASVAAYPRPDQKMRTETLETQGGGNCANALTAAARLGLSPTIVTKIGDDGLGDGMLSELGAEGVDTSLVLRAEGCPSPFTYIIVDRAGGTRTCIHTPGAPMGPGEMAPALVDAALAGAALVYSDGRLTEAALLLARAARRRGVPVLVEGERLRPGLEDLLAEADYVVTSAHFPQEWTGEATIGDAMVALAQRLPRARAIVTTRGTRGSVLLRRAGAGEQPAAAAATATPEAPLVAQVVVAPAAGLDKALVVDTTGAGDSFIGSMIYGIVTGLPWERTLALGSVVAACKCTALGARQGLPRRPQLRAGMLGAE
ncbi:MAG: PfkB-type carbohydrate kinase [Monoraphidium minutum]|nr:MAG: PfkB-type carbohydrate kinase [Monoraphidium minutum]